MWCLRVEHPRRVPDELAQHGRLGVQLDERELDALVARQRLAPRGPAVGVGDGLVDAVLRGARATTPPGGCGSRARSAGRARGRGRPRPNTASAPTRTSVSVTSAWSVGMLNVHQKKSTLKPGASVGTRKALMPIGRAGLAGRAGEDDVVGGVVQAGVEPLHAVDHPLVAVAHGGRLQVGGVGAVVRLGEPERQAARAVEEAGHPVGLLRVGAEVAHHQHGREVADDRALVLQVVVQAEALVRRGARG